MPRMRSLNYEAVKRARTGGVEGQVRLTYAELARKFGASESAVYYACNPQVRRHRRSAVGSPHSIYASDHTWAQLKERARRDEVSISKALEAILYHEDPEPLVRPLVGVEEQEEVPV